uniref:Uncharacterized protein n=1 Tax=Sphaerodactylus townsendi TaxID=933632 RepID=A0ACB8GFR5_9SAUR
MVVETILRDPPNKGLLLNRDSGELASLPDLLQGLCLHFEDLHASTQAKKDLKALRQGNKPFAVFARQFRAIAGEINDWPDRMLAKLFYDAVHPEIRRAIVSTTLVIYTFNRLTMNGSEAPVLLKGKSP